MMPKIPLPERFDLSEWMPWVAVVGAIVFAIIMSNTTTAVGQLYGSPNLPKSIQRTGNIVVMHLGGDVGYNSRMPPSSSLARACEGKEPVGGFSVSDASYDYRTGGGTTSHIVLFCPRPAR